MTAQMADLIRMPSSIIPPYTTLAQNDEYAKVCRRELSTSPAIPIPHRKE